MIQSFITRYDPDNRFGILFTLAISVFLCLLMEGVRIYISGKYTFLFLVWNLFLAFIPLAISTVMIAVETRTKNRLLAIAGVGLWLLFFPNAPYILTDLFHLHSRPNMPLWFDTAMLLTFAWTGLMMGFVSLMDIQGMITRRLGKAWGWVFASACLFLGSFGIYLGRFLRWNSWDILNHPFALAFDIADRILHPFQHSRTYGVTILFGVFLVLGYITLRQLMRMKQTR